MFGFGIGEVAAILTALKGLNEMLATVKETGSNASSFAGLISKYSDLDEKIRDVDSKAATKPLTLEESMKLQVAKRQAQSFHQALKDSLLMQQGGAQQYKEIMQRIEDSKIAHEKKINALKKKRREREKLFKEVLLWGFIGISCVAATVGGLWLWVKIFR
jgi:asparagine synthetase B (glutamine-hydrolysing)